MAADLPIPPAHPLVPGRPVPEEGDERGRFPRSPARRKSPEDDSDAEREDVDKPSVPPRRSDRDDDPNHIDEYA
ncbi:hypothetical protein [Ectothiorhodospira lacustris]|uniref:hypothetical protein n=1 Tax=Ectothiorhodospira lacustris TaxID=2899127 RepID=UPI001EE900C9|nr:hypothetical protein [Ectothiorhodospira lacustris]MCG5499503.1 hypothetical protein [Ectothiorhodospira lacustris]MCG5511081.1 hypothetical protein [Ectothiorhodospira lacustris]MCG5522911.1 hypothetical protein [Ectothiorhodospira lacustris]